jgi:hypothetical protein
MLPGGSAGPVTGRRGHPTPCGGVGARGSGVVVEVRAGRRSRVAGGRAHPVQCLFDAGEIAAVRAAAAADGVAVGAWCSSVALRATRERVEPLEGDWRLVMRELMALRRQARIIGGLLNQLAAAWNATGQLGGQAGRVLGMVERVVADVDVVTGRARERLR